MPHDRGSSLLVAIDNLLYLTEKGQCNRLVSCSIQYNCYRDTTNYDPILWRYLQPRDMLFCKVPIFLQHLPFRRQFQDLKKRVSSRYSHTDSNSATVAKTSLKNRIRVVKCRRVLDLSRSWILRDCLHGDGGRQIGEVTCCRSPHLSCKRDQIKGRDYDYGQAGYPT